VGSEVSLATSRADTAGARLQDAQELYANLTSVDLDEEAVSLVQHQTAYAAAAKVIQTADVTVDPLRIGAGLQNTILEALACGIPVVASTADGTREAVRGGELGLLADPHNPSILESTILTALSRPKAIPEGLSYFSFNNFEQRLRAAISQVTPL
jgi:glycosyltransferase involved in cell wall biosynthesis